MRAATDPIRPIMPLDALESMRARAWYAAAREWTEYRACTDPTIRPILLASARTAEDVYHRLNDELRQREAC